MKLIKVSKGKLEVSVYEVEVAGYEKNGWKIVQPKSTSKKRGIK